MAKVNRVKIGETHNGLEVLKVLLGKGHKGRPAEVVQVGPGRYKNHREWLKANPKPEAVTA